ncbi:MAG: DUF3786 domain-containing protein [Pseudomonadota bacterium]
MSEFANAMAVFKLLDKSNCRDCGEKTCLAFAGAVYQGKRQLRECPKIGKEIIRQYNGDQSQEATSIELEMNGIVEDLKKQVRSVDLVSIADRTGGRIVNNKLVIKTLGKDISIDSQGNLYSDIHLHQWITIPLLSYLLDCKGAPLSETWVPFRELKNGKTFAPLFEQRCEKPLKKVADTYTDLFEDMVHLFNGRQVEKHYQADISLVLHPLPKVPILICYWKPEDVLESSLHLFFDAGVEDNLNIRAVYSLTAGLVIMFEKISLRHGLR